MCPLELCQQRATNSNQQPDKIANHRDNDGFEYKLHQNVAFASADCHANTYLTGTFGDRDQHHIYDAPYQHGDGGTQAIKT